MRWAVFVGVLGCGSAVDATATTITPTTTSTSTSTTTNASASGGTAGDTDTAESGSSSSTEGGALFIIDPDGGGVHNECDVWKEDCPRGMKCMPWDSYDGGNEWNAYRCSPLDPDPAQIGEPCMVVDSPLSGVDDCPLHAMCWDVDPKTNMGKCVAFCSGSEANPTCRAKNAECWITDASVLLLCLPYCDPLLQDCPDGQGCYPVNDTFECSVDASGDAGTVGDPCESLDACDPGLFCADADVVPGCASTGCCAPLCDTSDPMSTETCADTIPGTACVPWYPRGQAPPGYENVGACITP